MAIEFHCEHCGKPIKAPDEAGGKHGKCPSCHQSVYVPSSSPEREPLSLTPVDDGEERDRERLLRESRAFQNRLLNEKDLPPERLSAATPRREAGVRPPVLDMNTIVTDYALAMASGDLNRAESLAVDIRRNMRAAEDVMQRITVDEILPVKLEKIPRPVLVGFFKQLREKK